MTSSSSKSTGPEFPGQLFDGETAATRSVTFHIRQAGIEIVDPVTGKVRLWTFSGLEAVDPPAADRDLRLRHVSEPGSRLTVPYGEAANVLVARAPHLGGRFNPYRAKRRAAVVVGLVIAACLAGYLVLSLLPGVLAALLPDSMRERLGDMARQSLVEGNRTCGNPAGLEALTTLRNRISSSLPDTPAFELSVVDLPIVNAFAVPGGRIIVSSALIREAQTPEEVAGVIAHELGHVYHRHPEAQFVRVMGVQLLLATVTGGSGTETLGGLAGLLGILRYSRAAETEADEFAARLMAAGRIDPVGLRDFFNRVKAGRRDAGGGLLSGIGDVLSSHPGFAERLQRILPLPPGAAHSVLWPHVFNDLRAICD